jgi:hypothetical protein
VKEIILGPNMPLEKILVCIALRRIQFPEAKLLLALPDPAEFKMALYQCPEKEELIKTAFQDVPNNIPPLGI